MKPRWISLGLVSLQLGGIAFLLLTGHLFAAPPWVFLELFGAGLLGWAVVTMQPHRVNPLPELRRDARLVTRGPYRWIRHPMYTGLLIALLALVLDRWTVTRFTAWSGLAGLLVVKLNYEERLLRRRFAEYGAYCKRTWRLIPRVY
jgi:protein-S-isoprenylcysteine O-methyltransferase Ste14